MKLFTVHLLCLAAAQQVASFSPAPHDLSSLRPISVSPLSASADVEALLAKAAKLKAEAAAAEDQLHKSLLEKKGSQEQDLDACIDMLFPVDDESLMGLVGRLQKTNWSTEKLMRITSRLHTREMAAQGKGRVSATLHHNHAAFDSVSLDSPKELARLQGLVDRLLDAADVIDEEYMTGKRTVKDQTYLNHVDMDHWTMGDLAGNLKRQVGELRREHEDQFQERQQSFNDAQRKKDLPNKVE